MINTMTLPITYQVPTDVTWNGVTASLCGRTFEEAFGLENAEWCQALPQRRLGLKLRTSPSTPGDLAAGLHKRVTGQSFDKTKFALGMLTESPNNWHVPGYIKEGLRWLDSEVSFERPAPPPEAAEPAIAAAAAVAPVAPAEAVG
jgi:hypothetical protein